jgi:cell division septum initiation protein DivIVA
MTNDDSWNAEHDTQSNAQKTDGSTDKSATPEELRADIEHTRTNLGQTVKALADKIDLKAGAGEAAAKAVGTVTTQARQIFQAARDKAGPIAQQAQVKARELAAKARNTATSHDDTQAQAGRSGAAVVAGIGAVLLAVWMLRRRRARRLTRWQRTVQTAQRRAQGAGAQARDQLRDKATELGAAVRNSDVAAQAQSRGQAAVSELAARARQAADAPEAKPRAQGAVAAAAILLALGCLRRSRAARRRGRTE